MRERRRWGDGEMGRWGARETRKKIHLVPLVLHSPTPPLPHSLS